MSRSGLADCCGRSTLKRSGTRVERPDLLGKTLSSNDRPSIYAARPVDRVRGVYDRLGSEQRAIEGLRNALSEAVRAHDYEFIETPVVEHTELFMRKSGGDRLAQIYAFNHRGRDLALRPEHTASIVRTFVENLQAEPLPVRLAYSGPVFRYEKPQAGRSRQFTEFGCELIGAGGLLADTEIIRLALHTLREAGIETPHIVLGHIGVVAGFLADLNIDQRAQDWLIWTMERLRDNHSAEIELPEYLVTSPEGPVPVERLDHLDPAAVIALLRQSGVQFEGASRTPEEIVSGLFEQRQRRYDPELMQGAIEFVTQLTRLAGPPDEVLGPLRQLVASRHIDPAPLDELERVIELLEAVDHERVTITIDLGMGRGLRYYTGMLFEIYAAAGGPQLCGGGRYDDLAQVLGARKPVEACGFSLGLERILSAGEAAETGAVKPRVLIWPGDDYAAAIRVAQDLRNQGWTAAVDPRARSASASRRAAHRQGYDAFVQQEMEGIELIRLSDGQATYVCQHPFAGTGAVVSRSTNLRVGLASKGGYEEATSRFLNGAGLGVWRPNPRQYVGRISSVEGAEVLFQRPEDIVHKVADGSLDLGITGYDLVAEHSVDAPDIHVVIPDLGFRRCELVLAVPDAWLDIAGINDLADLSIKFKRHGRTLRVATKFTNLVSDYLYRHGVNYFELIAAHGALEAAPSLGYADVIADLSETGVTLRDNHLRVIDGGVVLKAQACLIGNVATIAESPIRLEQARKIIELCEAKLAARKYRVVTANVIRRDSADSSRRPHHQQSRRGRRAGPDGISRVPEGPASRKLVLGERHRSRGPHAGRRRSSAAGRLNRHHRE